MNVSAQPIIIILAIFVASSLFSHSAYAQFANVAYTYIVTDKDAVEGDLLSIGEKPDELVRTTTANQDQLFGVLVKEPVIVYRTGTDKTPIVRQGEVRVGVLTANGAIKRGDVLVSSAAPGKAQKYTKGSEGRLVGIALEDFSGKAGTIAVALNLGGSIDQDTSLGAIFQSLAGTFFAKGKIPKDTEMVLRFFFAAIIASTAIIISYRTFGKNIAKGIEAMGRNPLARVQIQSMMMVNVILTLGVAILGIFLAIIIIKF